MKRLFTMIHKETLLVLRDRKAMWLLFFTVLLSSAVFFFIWFIQLNELSNMQERMRASRVLFTTMTVAELIAFALCTPLLAAGTVTIERERRTIDLLYCSGLRPLHILLGKWSSVVAFILLLLIALLPVEALVFSMGGVGGDEYLEAAMIIAVTVASYGMFGLYLSTRFRRSTMATVAALGILLLWNCVFPPLLILFFDKKHISPRDPAAWVALSSGSPFISMAMPLIIGENGLAPRVLRWSYQSFLSFHGVLFIFSSIGAWLGLSRREGHVESAARRRRLDALGERLGSLSPSSSSALSRLNNYLARVISLNNPIFRREFAFGAAGRGKALILLVVLAQLLSLTTLAMPYSILQDRGAQIAETMALAVCVILLPAWVATSITTEHEEKTWDLLRVTPVSDRQIVWGKLASYLKAVVLVFVTVGYLPFLLSFHAVPGELLMPNVDTWMQLLVPCAGFALFFGALMIYCSSRSRTNATALISCYIAILVLNAATLWIASDPPSFRWLNIGVQRALLVVFCPLIYFLDDGAFSWKRNSTGLQFSALAVMSALLLWRAEAHLRRLRRSEEPA